MFDFVIGLGQGGGRLAKSFKDGMDFVTVYMNLAGIDFAHMGVSKSDTLIFEEGGTGRDPVFGEKCVAANIKKVREFLSAKKAYGSSRYILLTVGGGGGAGSGFLFPLIDLLIADSKEVFLIFTLPEDREGIPTKPNALTTLDRLIRNYIQKEKISVLLIDNDYCGSLYGHSTGDYWISVNTGIVVSLKRFWVLTQLERFSGSIDVSAGYKALDANDLRRILFSRNGYADLRRMSFKEAVDEQGGLMRIIRESSLVFGSLDIRTTKQYVISIAIPLEWKELPWVSEFVESLFSAVSKSTKHTPAVIRTSYYNSKLKSIQVHLLLSGMSRGKRIDTLIRNTEKDQMKLINKSGVDRLDISAVVKNNADRRG